MSEMKVTKMEGGGFVIDNPDPVFMRMISLYHRLKLEVKNPNGPKWRVSPAKLSRQVLVEQGRPDPGQRKKNVYNAFGAYLVEMKVIQEHEIIK